MKSGIPEEGTYISPREAVPPSWSRFNSTTVDSRRPCRIPKRKADPPAGRFRNARSHGSLVYTPSVCLMEVIVIDDSSDEDVPPPARAPPPAAAGPAAPQPPPMLPSPPPPAKARRARRGAHVYAALRALPKRSPGAKLPAEHVLRAWCGSNDFDYDAAVNYLRGLKKAAAAEEAAAPAEGLKRAAPEADGRPAKLPRTPDAADVSTRLQGREVRRARARAPPRSSTACYARVPFKFKAPPSSHSRAHAPPPAPPSAAGARGLLPAAAAGSGARDREGRLRDRLRGGAGGAAGAAPGPAPAPVPEAGAQGGQARRGQRRAAGLGGAAQAVGRRGRAPPVRDGGALGRGARPRAALCHRHGAAGRVVTRRARAPCLQPCRGGRLGRAGPADAGGGAPPRPAAPRREAGQPLARRPGRADGALPRGRPLGAWPPPFAPSFSHAFFFPFSCSRASTSATGAWPPPPSAPGGPSRPEV